MYINLYVYPDSLWDFVLTIQKIRGEIPESAESGDLKSIKISKEQTPDWANVSVEASII
jgi:hypothetical protein